MNFDKEEREEELFDLMCLCFGNLEIFVKVWNFDKEQLRKKGSDSTILGNEKYKHSNKSALFYKFIDYKKSVIIFFYLIK